MSGRMWFLLVFWMWSAGMILGIAIGREMMRREIKGESPSGEKKRVR